MEYIDQYFPLGDAPAQLVSVGKCFPVLLDNLYKGTPLRCIETGTMRDLSVNAECGDGWSTLYIARWMKIHPDCRFDSVDLDINASELAQMALEAEGLRQCCIFHTQDSLKYLAAQTHADFCFLDSCDGLEHGLAEFKEADRLGAKLIVMDDYDAKAQLAVEYARNILGWQAKHWNRRYTILQRPV